MSAVATCVAPLFVPAHRPDRFVKAAQSVADAVILDLEDAVPRDAKEQARCNLRAGFTDKPVIVRINAAASPWHEADLAAIAASDCAAVMLPKAERMEEIAHVAAIRPVMLLIETARGVAMAREMAQSGIAIRIAFGSVDYAVDLGCDHVQEALAAARNELVLASRLGCLPAPLDGVTTDLADQDTAAADAEHAARLGFGGKLLIHPRQADAVIRKFLPAAEDIAWAERILATGDGAVSLNGHLVDEPVRRKARAIIAREHLHGAR